VTRRLRPTAPTATDAILVGDPGRALLLAQELLEKPKMSNHARGLWGYFGEAAGRRLTIQSTGMGGPSAAIVLADLVELGVRRVVRIGTSVALDPRLAAGDLLLVGEAKAAGGSGGALGAEPGETVRPDAVLCDRLATELDVDAATIASFDHIPRPGEKEAASPEVAAADMQTVAVLARARALEVAAAAVLIIVETSSGEELEDAELEKAAKRCGRASFSAFSG
jgi:uridine phosphorylase